MSTWREIRRAALLIGLLAGACATPDRARSGGPEPGEGEATEESRRELARLWLALAELEATGEQEAARAELEEARRALEYAREDLARFDASTAPIRLRQAQLELDESAFEVV